jgi:hypothetical protein
MIVGFIVDSCFRRNDKGCAGMIVYVGFWYWIPAFAGMTGGSELEFVPAFVGMTGVG